jgi:hypothetical protein
MLVLMKEAYPWAAMFIPYENVHGGFVPTTRETDPDPGGRGAALDNGMMGCPTVILFAAKLILRRSSMRDFASVDG